MWFERFCGRGYFLFFIIFALKTKQLHRMKKQILVVLLVLGQSLAFSQIFTVDNYYMVLKNSVNKNPSGFDADAFNAFLATIKVPVELLEQKVEGHVFVNVFIKQKTITQTSLMYGISSLSDNELVDKIASANIAWFGGDVSDSTQRFVLGVKVDYRFCSLANVSSSNLSSFDPEQSSLQNFADVQTLYNKFTLCYLFDSSSRASYKEKISKSKQKKAEEQLLLLDWFKPEYASKTVLLDYDNNKSINCIVQLQDSVHIVENSKLIFSEYGQLREIKHGTDANVILLESNCKDCGKINNTITVYKQVNTSVEEAFAITSYSSSPKIPVDSISLLSKVVFSSPVTYLRTSPYRINEPFNRCMGHITEQEQCIVPKSWGNIFGEVQANTTGIVLHNYTDSFKKHWYFVLIHRIDGYFVGWVHEDDVHLL